MTDIVLTDAQAKGVQKIKDWFTSLEYDDDERLLPEQKQIFRVFGFAGTGKTAITKHAIEELVLNLNSLEVQFCAFTGKAALVMRRNGTPARTIHSLIYSVHEATEGEIDQAKKTLKDLEKTYLETDDKLKKLQLNADIETLIQHIKNMKQPQFGLNPESDATLCKLIVLDECFPFNTIVDTPTGGRYIGDLRPGDLILNAHGVDEVEAVAKKEVCDAAQIVIGGKTITCSRNHPFFTKRGIVFAERLRPGDELLHTAEAMRFLLCHIYAGKKLDSEILQPKLFDALVDAISRTQAENLHGDAREEFRFGEKGISCFWNTGRSSANSENCGPESDIEARGRGEDQQATERDRAQTDYSRRKRTRINRSAESISFYLGRRLGAGIHGFIGQKDFWISHPLQHRFGASRQKNSNGIEREFTLSEQDERERQKESRDVVWVRVDSVRILEQGCSELDKFRDSSGSLNFYDIKATRHHSFSVEGLLVHNCSMAGPDMAADLMSFQKPILVLGDPGQLPPIRGEGAFTQAQPDVMLTEIHRQAAESPIIHLATLARQGRPIAFGHYSDEVWKLPKAAADPATMLNASQVICGLNATRLELNNAMRYAAGINVRDSLPTESDKIICLKNKNDVGLVNGMFVELSEIECDSDIYFKAYIKDEFTGRFLDSTTGFDDDDFYFPDDDEEVNKKKRKFRIYRGHFDDHVLYDKDRHERDWRDKKKYVELTFGNAITAHKAQGSGFPNVIIWQESLGRTPQDRARWLYTGITRAIDGLVIYE